VGIFNMYHIPGNSNNVSDDRGDEKAASRGRALKNAAAISRLSEYRTASRAKSQGEESAEDADYCDITEGADCRDTAHLRPINLTACQLCHAFCNPIDQLQSHSQPLTSV
jgi:hypothetical protein